MLKRNMPGRLRLFLLLLFLALIFVFSSWLMWHTFSYDQRSGQLLIASKVYSDFGSHIPLIRSFSFGSNWPVEYPLYPGQPIKYHYLFYLFAGMLERIGFHLDLALNSISALGFFSLCFMIFFVSRKMFSSTVIGIMSVLFFLFNGSFSFLDFLQTHPFSPHLLRDLLSNSVFPSFAPWNNSLISAFWNLNIYTNQRHLGLSFAVCLLLVYLLYWDRSRLRFAVGFILGSLLLLNLAVFLISFIFLVHSLFLRLRFPKIVLWSFVGLAPWMIMYFVSVRSSSIPVLYPGYLLPAGSDILGFVKYWFYNFGFHLLFIPLGLFFAPKPARRLWFPLLLLFIIPNLFRLSPDLINNHKFFNFFLILGYPFSAFLVVKFWRSSSLGKAAVMLVFPLLVLGGVVDIFPVINDYFVRVSDAVVSQDIRFFRLNTSPRSVILNDIWFFHPASLAGRAIFNGYPYFTWSYGYDQVTRENTTSLIYSSPTKSLACSRLIQNGIDYVELSPVHEAFLQPNRDMWNSDFHRVYQNVVSGFSVYSVKDSCLPI